MKKRLDSSLNRRTFLSTAGLSLTGSVLSVNALRARAQDPPATSFVDLRGGVGIFNGRGGTIGWFVSPEAVAAIDTQFPDTARIFLDGLNQRSGSRRIDLLIYSHHHGDHVAGGPVLRPVTKRIVAHEKVPALMREAAARQSGAPEPAFPDATFGKTWVEELGKEKVQLEHFGPAHTGGDAVMHFEKAGVVHMGDLVFNRRHPFIDKPAGASIAGWIQVLEKVAAKFKSDVQFVFGHAGDGWAVTGGTPELLHQRDYLTALLDFVGKRIKAGDSRESIVGSTAELPGFPEHGPLVERVLQAAHVELTAG